MAGRKEVMSRSSSAVAVAVAIMAVALLAAAAEAGGTCNVDARAVVHHCMSACSGGGRATPSRACCNVLRRADLGCLCRNYWGALRGTAYAGCAMAIPSKCNIRGAPTSC